MKKLKIRKTTLIRSFIFVLLVFSVTSCDSDLNSELRFTEYGSLLWLNDQMADNVIKKAVQYTVENSSIIIAQIPWDPSDMLFMNNLDWYSSLAIQHGKGLMINVDWLSNDRQSTRNSSWSFEDDSISDQFSKDMNLMVAKYKPEMLILGVEVNYYAFNSPSGYKGFVLAFNTLKNSLKEKYPKMKIGISFQLELLYGIDKNWSQIKVLQPLDAVVENLDFIGVSTYPDLHPNKEGVALLSANYIDSLMVQYSVPIGISETGISSLNFNKNQRSLYLQNIFSNSNRFLFIVWGSMIDSNQHSSWMSRIGLLDFNALPKEECEVWLDEINSVKSP